MREAPLVKRTINARGVALAAPWGGPLPRVDSTRDREGADGGRRAWERARLAPVESLSWEDLIAIGDAGLRIGGAVGARPSAELAARRVYFAALYRACREESLEGILRAAEAFAGLGEGEVVEECLGLAELKVDGEEARRHLSILVQRLESAQAQARRAAAAGLDRPGRPDGAVTD